MPDHFQGRHSTLFNHLHKPIDSESSPLERGTRSCKFNLLSHLLS